MIDEHAAEAEAPLPGAGPREIRIPDPADRSSATGDVVRGDPSDEELAAVVAVLTAVFESGRAADRPRDIAERNAAWARTQRSMRNLPGDPFATSFGRL